MFLNKGNTFQPFGIRKPAKYEPIFTYNHISCLTIEYLSGASAFNNKSFVSYAGVRNAWIFY